MRKRLISLLLILGLLFPLPTVANAAFTTSVKTFERGGVTAKAMLMATMVCRWLRAELPAQDAPPPAQEPDVAEMPTLQISIGGKSYAATLEDNDATRAFVQLLPLTVSMGELNGNEKYHYLDSDLPTDSQSPGNIAVGDLMLYGDDCLVLFYESFPTAYRYTRLGRVDDPAGLAAALGGGSVEVTFQAP